MRCRLGEELARLRDEIARRPPPAAPAPAPTPIPTKSTGGRTGGTGFQEFVALKREIAGLKARSRGPTHAAPPPPRPASPSATASASTSTLASALASTST